MLILIRRLRGSRKTVSDAERGLPDRELLLARREADQAAVETLGPLGHVVGLRRLKTLADRHKVTNAALQRVLGGVKQLGFVNQVEPHERAEPPISLAAGRLAQAAPAKVPPIVTV